MTGVGTMALEEGGRVDFGRLRRERRVRVDALMTELDLDVLLLGREYNAKYAAGVRRLATGGTRPFAPSCVIVRATGECHVMNVWDEGIPEAVQRDHIFGMSWNPMRTIERLGRIPGVAEARRVGIDSMSPVFARLLAGAIPDAEIIDAETPLRQARFVKTADEVECIRTAVAIAEAALVAAAGALRPGVRERDLLATFEDRMAGFGTTVPAIEGTFCVTGPAASGQPGLRRLVGEGTVNAGDLVAMGGGVLYAGYEGAVGRTWPCAGPGSSVDQRAYGELHDRWRKVVGAVVEACRAGATGADLRAAYENTGESLPPFPVARSIGLGYEAPVAGSPLGADFDARWRLEPGMVLALDAVVAGARGAWFGTETVLVTRSEPEILSTLGDQPVRPVLEHAR
jgi:Xaa-Pro dipeptidase